MFFVSSIFLRYLAHYVWNFLSYNTGHTGYTECPTLINLFATYFSKMWNIEIGP